MKESSTHVRSDCPRCNSTGSIEFGICQVCLVPVQRKPRPWGIPQKSIRLDELTRALSSPVAR